MKLANAEIRKIAKEKGVPLWRVGKALGMSEATTTRMLRTELNEQEKTNILDVIEKIGREHSEE